MELQNYFIVNVLCIISDLIYYLCCLLYFVVVEEVHADLHDAREDHQNGGGDKEGVDVV